jgi:hypothetical protein
MGSAGDNGPPTPQQVLKCLHKAVTRLKIRLPQVTPAIEALARALNPTVLADLTKDLTLGLQTLRGLKQAREGVAAYLPRLGDAIAELPLVDPRRGRLLEDRRRLNRVQACWDEITATDFIQNATLMTDDPLDPSPRKDLAIMQTIVFAGVSLVFEQSGLPVGTSDASIACRATAELISRFTCHNTTSAATGSALRRQLANQKQALSDLVDGVKKAP